MGIDEDVVLNETVAPTPDGDGRLRVHHEVAVHGDAAEAVVEIDDECFPTAGAVDIVHVVVADEVVAVGPVAARVDGPHVAGFVTDMVDVVVLVPPALPQKRMAQCGWSWIRLFETRVPTPSRFTAGK